MPPRRARPSGQSSGPSPPAIVRKLLFPQLPADEPLPALFAGGRGRSGGGRGRRRRRRTTTAVDDNGTEDEDETHERQLGDLDAEVYLLIALLLRAYVNVWFHPLSPRSTDLLPSLARSLSLALQTAQARTTACEVAEWVRTDVPDVLGLHLRAYRAAEGLVGGRAAGGQWKDEDEGMSATTADSSRRSRRRRRKVDELYGHLNPHIALLPISHETAPATTPDYYPRSSEPIIARPSSPLAPSPRSEADRARATTPGGREGGGGEGDGESPIIDPLYLTQLAGHLLPFLLSPPLEVPSAVQQPPTPLAQSPSEDPSPSHNGSTSRFRPPQRPIDIKRSMTTTTTTSRLATPLERSIASELLGRTVFLSVLSKLSKPAFALGLLSRREPLPPPLADRSSSEDKQAEPLNDLPSEASESAKTVSVSSRSRPPQPLATPTCPPPSSSLLREGPREAALLGLALSALNGLALLLVFGRKGLGWAVWTCRVWRSAKVEERRRERRCSGSSGRGWPKEDEDDGELQSKGSVGADQGEGDLSGGGGVDGESHRQAGYASYSNEVDDDSNNDDGRPPAFDGDYLDPWLSLIRELCSGPTDAGGSSSSIGGETAHFVWSAIGLLSRVLHWAALNTIMPHLLQETLSSPALATAVVQKLRAIMFPLSLDGSGRPPSPRPSSHLPPSSSSKDPMGKRPPLPSDEDAASGAWTAVDRSEADLTEEAEWDKVRLQIERSIPNVVKMLLFPSSSASPRTTTTAPRPPSDARSSSPHEGPDIDKSPLPVDRQRHPHPPAPPQQPATPIANRLLDPFIHSQRTSATVLLQLLDALVLRLFPELELRT